MYADNNKVLVMDDEDIVCRSYERVLSRAGFEVGTAHSGSEALEKARAGDYGVMLADLKMPGMDGLEVVEKLRETRPEMPVVVITGFPSEDTMQNAARLGVREYLTKPVAPDILTEATVQAMRTPAAPGQATAIAIPIAATGPIPWPIAPLPTAPPPRPAAASVAAAPATDLAEPGALATAARLALAPLVSIAYVMFLPFLGFAMFFGLGAKALFRRLRPGTV